MLENGGQQPTARHGHRMIYDEGRRITVSFGGMGEGKEPLGDTWGWNGSTWVPLSSEGPAPRAWHAMAYDRGRGVSVLFGGRDRYDAGASYGDTWEWDGEQWRLVSQSGPAARDHIVMTYDPLRGKTVLFGGYDGLEILYGDTWEWDGKAWTQVATTGPSARAAHHTTFDPQLGETLLFGGLNFERGNVTVLGDTWSWNGKRWERATQDIEGRSHFSMAYVLDDGCVIRFGGGDATRTPREDTWKFSAGRWSLTESIGPQARIDHAMAFDAHRQKTVLFGGCIPKGGPAYGDVWEWNGKTWKQAANGSKNSLRRVRDA